MAEQVFTLTIESRYSETLGERSGGMVYGGLTPEEQQAIERIVSNATENGLSVKTNRHIEETKSSVDARELFSYESQRGIPRTVDYFDIFSPQTWDIIEWVRIHSGEIASASVFLKNTIEMVSKFLGKGDRTITVTLRGKEHQIKDRQDLDRLIAEHEAAEKKAAPDNTAQGG